MMGGARRSTKRTSGKRTSGKRTNKTQPRRVQRGRGRGPNETCAICLEDGTKKTLLSEFEEEITPIHKSETIKNGYFIQEQVQICPNGHYAHFRCIKDYYKHDITCPECRVDVRATETFKNAVMLRFDELENLKNKVIDKVKYYRNTFEEKKQNALKLAEEKAEFNNRLLEDGIDVWPMVKEERKLAMDNWKVGEDYIKELNAHTNMSIKKVKDLKEVFMAGYQYEENMQDVIKAGDDLENEYKNMITLFMKIMYNNMTSLHYHLIYLEIPPISMKRR